jgi:hypothetical protein
MRKYNITNYKIEDMSIDVIGDAVIAYRHH